MSAWAIITAGGKGKRMGTDTPKQLLELCGVTILERTLKPFMECPEIEGIIVTASADSIEQIKNIPALHGKLTVVEGGLKRQDSVFNGLQAVPEDTEIVVIHDAVRPFITKKLISECVFSAERNGAVTVMRPLKETVKVVSDGVVKNTPDRSSLRITQTPQAFRTGLILKAHTRAREEGFTGTDDCMLVERIGFPVHIIEGDDLNIKITTPTDLKIAGVILAIHEKREEKC